MTQPLSWMRKLPQAEREQCASDLRHIVSGAVEKPFHAIEAVLLMHETSPNSNDKVRALGNAISAVIHECRSACRCNPGAINWPAAAGRAHGTIALLENRIERAARTEEISTDFAQELMQIIAQGDAPLPAIANVTSFGEE